MNLAEYHKLSADEKNALIAEKVMGWNVLYDVVDQKDYWAHIIHKDSDGDESESFNFYVDEFDPLGSMDLAMGLVEDFPHVMLFTSRPKRWFCRVVRNDEMFGEGSADTPQEAICIAALKAKGVITE